MSSIIKKKMENWTSKNHDLCLLYEWDGEQPDRTIIDCLKIARELRNPESLLGKMKFEGCEFDINDKLEIIIEYLLK